MRKFIHEERLKERFRKLYGKDPEYLELEQTKAYLRTPRIRKPRRSEGETVDKKD